MKKVIGFLRISGLFGRDKTTLAAPASGLLIALVLAVLAPAASAGDGSQCPAFSAAEFDGSFLDWAASMDFDPDIGALTCFALPGNPDVAFIARNADGSKFYIYLVPSSADPTRHSAIGCSDDALADTTCWSNTDDLSGYDRLATSEAYACRAEVMRSFTWRQLCAGNVTRP